MKLSTDKVYQEVPTTLEDMSEIMEMLVLKFTPMHCLQSFNEEISALKLNKILTIALIEK